MARLKGTQMMILVNQMAPVMGPVGQVVIVGRMRMTVLTAMIANLKRSVIIFSKFFLTFNIFCRINHSIINIWLFLKSSNLIQYILRMPSYS